MTPDSLLQRLRDELSPGDDTKTRLKRRIEQRIALPAILEEARREATPGTVFRKTIFERILHRLRPAPEPAFAYRRGLRWSAFAALILTALRISPLLFLPSHTIAESPVTILPIRGEVSVLIGGLWQPVQGEVRLTRSALIQTNDGEATVVSHDDFVVRLAPNTTVALHDLSDRPAAALHDPTLTLHAGRVWVQGFVPTSLGQGISVQTNQGKVILSEGSISIAMHTDIIDINIWNRRAQVVRDDVTIPVLSGERLRLWNGNVPRTETIDATEYEQEGVLENLKKDAVHQREIAHLQQERRAAAAGILPTSPLYSMKRAAEAVDILLTFSGDSRTKKRLDHAKTRLNEAAGLIAEGSSSEAGDSLAEYREAFLSVASGTGADIGMQSLIQQELNEASADVAAALPDDDLYALKETVLETSAAFTGSIVSALNVQEVLVADTVSDITLKAGEGKEKEVKEALDELEPFLTEETSPLSDDVKKEVTATLSVVAVTLHGGDADANEEENAELLEQVNRYLPRPIVIATVTPMTEEEMTEYVQKAYDRIFLYSQQRPRWNQLLQEFLALDGNPNQGPLLRRLYHALPEDGLARYVRTEIQRVREEQEDGNLTE